jgi:microcompartment protein CcmL/EutN
MNPVAIAAVETSSIAQGMVVADAMVKTADIEVVESTTLSPGKYWVLIGGGVAPVRASFARGLEVAADTLLDSLLIPQLDEQVMRALRGTARSGGARAADDALGVLETLTASSAILAADAAAKASAITLRDVRLANGLGGKGVVTLSGSVSDVQAAVDAGRADAQRRGLLARWVVIPRLAEPLRARFL